MIVKTWTSTKLIDRLSMILAFFSVCAMWLSLTGCQRISSRPQAAVSPDVAPGTVVVDVISAKTETVSYWRYRITPSKGAVEETESGRRPQGSWPMSHFPTSHVNCFEGSQATSPNQQIVAR